MIRGTGIDSTVKLYLKGNGANGSTKFFDDSQSHKSITAHGSAEISTAVSKFGGSAMYFDFTTGCYITTPTITNMLTDKFCIGFWSQVGDTNNHSIMSQNDAGAAYMYMYFRINNTLKLTYTNASRIIITDIIYTISTPTSAMSYFMLYCDGSDVNLYQDGSLCTRTVNKVYMAGVNISGDLHIGAYAVNLDTELMYGYIDDLIIKVGDPVSAIDPTVVPTRQRG